MRRPAIAGLVIGITLAAAMWLSPWKAMGFPTDGGHAQDWFGYGFGLQQSIELSPSDALYHKVRVCSSEFPNSVAAAINNWNQALGFNAFDVSNCSPDTYEVIVGTPNYGACNDPNNYNHACTLPTQPYTSGYPDYNIVKPTGVLMNPYYFGPGRGDYADGGWHTNRDVTHEFGHVLGITDYQGCPDGLTLMDTTESGCTLQSVPQQVDKDNYHILYHPDAVENLTATSPSANRVVLNWNEDPNGAYQGVANEGSFSLYELVYPNWNFVTTIGVNGETVTLNSVTAGSHTYVLYSNSWADNYDPICHCSPSNQATVTVSNPVATPTPPPSVPSAPSWMSSYFPNTSTDTLSWGAVSGATYYVFCWDTSVSGLFTACYPVTSGTSFNVGLPATSDDNVQWYNKVKACNSAGCSGFGPNYTLTERAAFAGWQYVFTFYRGYGSETTKIKFQFINFENLPLYGQFKLKLHIKNGSSVGTPYVSPDTPCISYNQKSSVLTYSRSLFTSKLGTVGHDLESASACGTAETADAQQNRWGYRP